MKYREALVFSHQRFENALISIISSGPLTRFTSILKFPVFFFFFFKTGISLELLNSVFKNGLPKGNYSGKIDSFF